MWGTSKEEIGQKPKGIEKRVEDSEGKAEHCRNSQGKEGAKD